MTCFDISRVVRMVWGGALDPTIDPTSRRAHREHESLRVSSREAREYTWVWTCLDMLNVSSTLDFRWAY